MFNFKYLTILISEKTTEPPLLKIHYKVFVFLWCFCAGLLTGLQYLGKPISCEGHDSSRLSVQAVTDFCSEHGIYTSTNRKDQDNAFPGSVIILCYITTYLAHNVIICYIQCFYFFPIGISTGDVPMNDRQYHQSHRVNISRYI